MSISVPSAARCAGLALFVGAVVALPAVAAGGSAPVLKSPIDKSYAAKSDKPYGVTVSTKVPFTVESGGGPVFVVVSKHKGLLKDVDADAVKKATYVREMAHRGGIDYAHTVPIYNAVPSFWTNKPAKYWWTAVRVDCEAAKGTDDCAIEGEIRQFEVFGQIDG